MKVVRATIVFLLLITSLLFLERRVFAQACTDKPSLTERISCYEQELTRLGAQSKTLSNQIAQFDAQIRLTTLKISQTEEKISLLGGRIDQLEGSLSALSEAFSSRVVETYKMARVGDPFLILISAPDLSGAVSRFHYLQRIQEADRDLLSRLQSAQTTYKEEKTDQETLQAQLQKQKADLDRQKKEKANLLTVTKNDERKYQELLAAARAELAVVLGQGKETFLRNVSEGERIGSVISGRSGCSTGTHLHFEIRQGGGYLDPNNYLRSISFSYDEPYDKSYYGAISPHGSWNWPLNEPIQINQGFGSHGYARVAYPYTGGVHTGIDMVSGSSSTVKAVRSGKLYGGSYQCTGSLSGTLLYAKIDHGDGLTAWYLHITPQ